MKKEITINKEVKSHSGNCIGYIIEEQELFGKVVKVNKSSFRVLFTKEVAKRSGEVTRERNITQEVSYKFWKEVNGRKLYIPTISGGKTIYGVIEL